MHKGTWKGLPSRKQRLLAFYTLSFPMFQALLGLYFLFSLLTMFSLKTPVQVALISYLPVVMLMAHFLVSVVGLREFTAAHGLKMTRADVVRMAFAWIPYQLVLAYAAGRWCARCAASTTGRRPRTWARIAGPPA